MSSADLLLCSKALILKISVITGWIIPDDADILIDAFTKKMILNYSTVNPDEVEYAFISNPSGVKDWGKSLNLGLIDEIMIPYLNKRFELSQFEEHKKLKELEAPKENLSDKTMQEWLEEIKKENQGPDFMPVMLYDWLDAKGELRLSLGRKRDYMERSKFVYLQRHNDKSRSLEETRKILQDTAKKLALYDFINGQPC